MIPWARWKTGDSAAGPHFSAASCRSSALSTCSSKSLWKGRGPDGDITTSCTPPNENHHPTALIFETRSPANIDWFQLWSCMCALVTHWRQKQISAIRDLQLKFRIRDALNQAYRCRLPITRSGNRPISCCRPGGSAGASQWIIFFILLFEMSWWVSDSDSSW